MFLIWFFSFWNYRNNQLLKYTSYFFILLTSDDFPPQIHKRRKQSFTLVHLPSAGQFPVSLSLSLSLSLVSLSPLWCLGSHSPVLIKTSSPRRGWQLSWWQPITAASVRLPLKRGSTLPVRAQRDFYWRGDLAFECRWNSHLFPVDNCSRGVESWIYVAGCFRG